MLISNNISQITLPTGADPHKLLQNMRPGQLLQATVVSQTTKDVVGLRIGTLEVQAHTKLLLSAGQRLSLEVTKAGDRPELRLLQAPTNPEPKARALRQTLPNQMPPTRLLENLRTLEPSLTQQRQLTETLSIIKNQLISNTTRLSPEFVTALRTLIANHKGTITPETQRAIKQFLAHPKDQPQPEILKAAQQVLKEATAKTVPQPLTSNSPMPSQAKASPNPQAAPSPSPATTATDKPQIKLDTAPNIAKQLEGLLDTKTAPQLQRVIQSLVARILPGEQPLVSSQLRRALSESGLFLEASLAKGGQPAANDLKANLVRLLELLRPLFEKSALPTAKQTTSQEQASRATTPESALSRILGELLRQSEGSLARVQLHQLSSLPAEDGPRQLWQFEVPVQYQERVDNFLVRLEQERAQQGDQDEDTWTLTLNFDFQPLGPVEARLILQGEEISSLFQASHPMSASLIEKNLPQLNDAFERAGLKVGNLHARHAEVKVDTPSPPSSPPLLDEKA
jgi:hypothetical protein